MSEIIKPESLPYKCVKEAYENRHDLDMVMDDLMCTRQEARAVIRYAVNEFEQDNVAAAPSSTSYLQSRIDTALAAEIERLITENLTLDKITKQKPGKQYRDRGTGIMYCPETAMEKMRFNVKSLMELKKTMSEAQKVQTPDNSTNVNINLGSIIGDALQNIKEVDAEQIRTKEIEE